MVANCHTPPRLTLSHDKSTLGHTFVTYFTGHFPFEPNRVFCSILVVESWQRYLQYEMNRRSGMEGRLGVGGGMVSEESQRK